MCVNASLAVEVNRRNWRRHVSGTSFSCLVCATWTQVSGDQFLVPETWVENLGRVPSALAMAGCYLVVRHKMRIYTVFQKSGTPSSYR